MLLILITLKQYINNIKIKNKEVIIWFNFIYHNNSIL